MTTASIMAPKTEIARAVFYSEFDNVVGPKIVYQAPLGYLAADEFDSISDFVITKPQLCGRTVTMCACLWRASQHKTVQPLTLSDQLTLPLQL